jgi:hypothetical protein
MAYAENYTATLSQHYVAPSVNSGSAPSSSRASVLSALGFGKTRALGESQPVPPPPVTRRAPAEVRLPCMVYAAVGGFAHEMGDEAAPAIVDARSAPGVLQVIRYEGATVDGLLACRSGVASIARGQWLARQALVRLMERLGPVHGAASRKCAEPAGGGAAGSACTAQMVDGRLRLWIAGGDVERIRATAGQLAGMLAEQVDLQFVRGSENDLGPGVLVPAIALARALQPLPVQVIVAYDLGLHRVMAPRTEEPRIGAPAPEFEPADLAPAVALAA